MSLRSTPSQKSVVSPYEVHRIPSFDASNCPILNVVVYPDRAEVTRNINVSVKEGLSLIKMTSMSKCVDPSTIRVMTLSNSILNEVNFTTRSVLDEYADTGNKLDELRERQTELLKESAELDIREQSLRKQKEILETFASRLTSPKSSESESEPVTLSSFELISTFLPMYEARSAKIHEGLTEVREQKRALEGKLKEVTDEINSTDPTKDGIVSREVHILIEAYEEEEVKLLVSYVVTECGWTPKYDLRVHTRDKNLKVLYFGVVSQSTGEDWTNAKIKLSTASPSTGGLPALGTHELYGRANSIFTPSLKRNNRATSMRRKKSEKSIRISAPPSETAATEDEASNMNSEMRESEENLAVDFNTDESGARESGFESNRPATISTTYPTANEEISIPSDRSEHKVHIAKIDLPAAFFYASCPRISPHAFLRITARNDSAYALLAGRADIFLDGNFCSKTTLKDICPTEDFEIEVGADPTIRVYYRPLLRHKETGTKTTLISYTQDIELRNARKDGPISILVTDQLPKSTDEKIKVNLHEPDIKKKKESIARLNSSNNIEWTVEIPSDSSAKLHLRYSVEYPIHMDITGLI